MTELQTPSSPTGLKVPKRNLTLFDSVKLSPSEQERQKTQRAQHLKAEEDAKRLAAIQKEEILSDLVSKRFLEKEEAVRREEFTANLLRNRGVSDDAIETQQRRQREEAADVLRLNRAAEEQRKLQDEQAAAEVHFIFIVCQSFYLFIISFSPTPPPPPAPCRFPSASRKSSLGLKQISVTCSQLGIPKRA